jgi:hypothetical protein
MRDREFHDKDRLDQDAFEDPPAHAEFEAPEDGPRDCRRNHWAMKVVPTCNLLHFTCPEQDKCCCCCCCCFVSTHTEIRGDIMIFFSAPNSLPRTVTDLSD